MMRKDVTEAPVIASQDIMQVVANVWMVNVAVMFDYAGAATFDEAKGIDMILGIIEIILLSDSIDIAVVVTEGGVSNWWHVVAKGIGIIAWITISGSKERISLSLPSACGNH